MKKPLAREKLEPYSGTFRECLIHFDENMRRLFPGAKGYLIYLKDMFLFCRISAKVYGDCVTERHQTNSERLLRMMFFLSLMGYDVEEVEKMSPAIRNACELFVYDVISIDQLRDFTSYAEKSTLLKILIGKDRLSETKAQRFWDVWKSRREALDEAKEKLLKRLRKYYLFKEKTVSENFEIQEKEIEDEERPKKRTVVLTCIETVKEWTSTAKVLDESEFVRTASLEDVLEIARFWGHLANLIARDSAK